MLSVAARHVSDCEYVALVLTALYPKWLEAQQSSHAPSAWGLHPMANLCMCTVT